MHFPSRGEKWYLKNELRDSQRQRRKRPGTRPHCFIAKRPPAPGTFRGGEAHQVFFRQKCAKSISLQDARQSESFTRKPRRNERFRSAAAKSAIVSCRPPDYTARDGLHIVDGAEQWCGPARRLANPCVGRTSGAPSCALFYSPVPGPGHATRYLANVLWCPRFS